MYITVNGENKLFDAALTVADLLVNLQLDTRKIAVEHNREIVAKSTYDTTIISDGDQIEIVAFIGGG